MQIPSRTLRPFLLAAMLPALLMALNPTRAADKEPTADELKARVKELEEKVTKLEATIKEAGIGELSAEETAKFKQFMDGMDPEERKDAENEIAKMTPAERQQMMHRITSMQPADLQRSKKRNQATRVLEDLRLLDSAIDQYAIETNKVTGMHPSFADLKNYLRSGTVLYNTGKDSFGHPFGPFTVDSIPLVNPETFNALSDVADESFWSPFK